MWSAASLGRAGMTCEYVSTVSVTVEWPSLFWTTFGWTPRVNSKVAAACRRS